MTCRIVGSAGQYPKEHHTEKSLGDHVQPHIRADLAELDRGRNPLRQRLPQRPGDQRVEAISINGTSADARAQSRTIAATRGFLTNWI